MGEDDLPEEDEKRCSRMMPTDPEYPPMISDTIWMKGDRMGERKAGEVELGKRGCGRD